jgi:hypothetical protein
MWVDFNMWNLVVHYATAGPQRVNFHQATAGNSEITVYYIKYGSSINFQGKRNTVWKVYHDFLPS